MCLTLARRICTRMTEFIYCAVHFSAKSFCSPGTLPWDGPAGGRCDAGLCCGRVWGPLASARGRLLDSICLALGARQIPLRMTVFMELPATAPWRHLVPLVRRRLRCPGAPSASLEPAFDSMCLALCRTHSAQDDRVYLLRCPFFCQILPARALFPWDRPGGERLATPVDAAGRYGVPSASLGAGFRLHVSRASRDTFRRSG